MHFLLQQKKTDGYEWFVPGQLTRHGARAPIGSVSVFVITFTSVASAGGYTHRVNTDCWHKGNIETMHSDDVEMVLMVSVPGEGNVYAGL